MAYVSFSFPQFDHFNGGNYDLGDPDKEERITKGKQHEPLCQIQDFAGFNNFFTDPVYETYQHSSSKGGIDSSKNQNSEPMEFYQFQPDAALPFLPATTDGRKFGATDKASMSIPPSKTSLELLTNYWNVNKKSKEEKTIDANPVPSCQKLSTEAIMKIAGTMYIQFSDQRDNYFTTLVHPYSSSFLDLSEEDKKEVDLALLLLAAAEKVGEQQLDRASRLLSYCELIASKRESPAQRLVLYFAEALRERIDKETGRFVPKGLEDDLEKLMKIELSTSAVTIASLQRIPFSQVTQFTGIQAIIESTASSSRIHVIDLAIRSGVQWTVLMQALVNRNSCPVEHLKITAIKSTGQEKLELTGKRLVDVAESMKIPFSFSIISVEDMEKIEEEQFNIEDNEAVVIFAQWVLRTMLSRPRSLEKLISVLRSLNPSIMVVSEVEANHNSPSLMSRFIEALFFYSAYFDCLDTCMADDDELRMTMEKLFSCGMLNIVSMDGPQRITRNVKINVWRAFFARFKMVEIGFSESSLYQASLVAEKYAKDNFCTLGHSGKCLLVGWKGTPVFSLSAWKFS